VHVRRASDGRSIFDKIIPMSSSTRLYERLGQISNDPDDLESLEDVIVCAFGAFERYYVCWKTIGGAYRQGTLTSLIPFLNLL
jgi:hypothetical protein